MKSYKYTYHLIPVSIMLLLPLTDTAIANDTTAASPAEPYCQWQLEGYEINESLCGLKGNLQRGEAIASDSNKGNCLACHQLPIDGIEAYGNIGPPLQGVGSRLSKGFIRLRVVDTRAISPTSIMPGFYRNPELIHRPGKEYKGKTFLSAQQIEDVVEYLVTLK